MVNPYIDMKTDLRKVAKNILMNNAAFEKGHRKCEKTQRYQICNNWKKKQLINIRTKLSYNKIFSENLLAVEMRKTQTIIIKPVYLGLSILELSKIVMHEFWCDYVKPNYDEKAKLCYMDTESFVVYIKRWYL